MNPLHTHIACFFLMYLHSIHLYGGQLCVDKAAGKWRLPHSSLNIEVRKAQTYTSTPPISSWWGINQSQRRFYLYILLLSSYVYAVPKRKGFLPSRFSDWIPYLSHPCYLQFSSHLNCYNKYPLIITIIIIIIIIVSTVMNFRVP